MDLSQNPHAETVAALQVIHTMLDSTTDQPDIMEDADNYVAAPMTPITIKNAEDFV